MGRETVLRNITYPTLTPILPKRGTANGTAVIVAPGGGFAMLSMQNEGWRVAQALAERGITVFVLKYRLNPTPRDDAAFMGEMSKMFAAAGKPGAARPEIKDPGASEDALTSLRLKAPVAAERPDFFGYIYGPMAAVPVPADAPPMFAALAMDDPLFGNGDFGIVSAWKAAQRPVELHVYAGGSHGFGLGQPGTTSTLMIDQFLAWLDSRGLLKRETAK
jgi:acetyl esterase/lipase